jgi:hypothetical protein
VVEAIRATQTGQTKTACPTEFDARTKVFHMAASTEHFLRRIDLPVQSLTLIKLLGDWCVTLQTGLCQLGHARCTRKMRWARAMTGDAIAAAVEFRDLRVHRGDRPRSGVA